MIEKILTFWFEECSSKDWYSKSDELDEKIVDQFKDVYWQILAGETATWRESAKGRLAEIIVLDQFARNMFRDDAQTFAADMLALALAQEAVRIGADQEVDTSRRGFFYMPYMHSESSRVHEDAVKLFDSLGNEGSNKFEIMHKEIIDQFGRYPHRNEVLGRTSTPKEIAYLKEHSGF